MLFLSAANSYHSLDCVLKNRLSAFNFCGGSYDVVDTRVCDENFEQRSNKIESNETEWLAVTLQNQGGPSLNSF